MEPAAERDGTREELLGAEPERLRGLLAASLGALGEPAYRLDQLLGWIYERRADSFAEMSNLPRALRESLDAGYSLRPNEMAYEARSSDGTIKHLWRLADGEQVESVLIPAGDRVTLCLSSQAGCALGCRFCATGDFGFRRQLSAAEIVAQFRDAERVSTQAFGVGIANVVYMGMGEPFANLERVQASLTILHDGMGLGARRITVSTVGIVPGILALAARPEAFRLAVSLHAPNHDLRERLVPVEKRWPLPELLDAVRAYQDAKGRRVSFEYTLIEGVNDAPALARELVGLLRPIAAFVNLIPWNPVPGRAWRTSPPERVAEFQRILETAGVPAAVRTPRGRDIAAACGQLRLEREISADSRTSASASPSRG